MYDAAMSKNLKRHMINHDRDQLSDDVKLCPYCNKFISAIRLKEHIKGKKGEKSLGCAVRYEFVTFVKRRELKTPENKTLCTKCRSYLSPKINLNRHMKRCKRSDNKDVILDEVVIFHKTPYLGISQAFNTVGM